MKTAYVPVENLPLIQELHDNFETIEQEIFSLYERFGKHPKFRKTILGVGRNEPNKGKQSYYGTVKNIGLLLDDVVLDPQERVLAYGKDDANREQKQAMIKSRRETTKWINQWILRNIDNLCHVSLFIMHPGSAITPHYGVSDAMVRVHLGILCPPEVKFYTDFDEPRQWRRNETFGFLDYEVNHWVKFDQTDNQTPRIVFCADVVRPYYEKYYPGVVAALKVELGLN